MPHLRAVRRVGDLVVADPGLRGGPVLVRGARVELDDRHERPRTEALGAEVDRQAQVAALTYERPPSGAGAGQWLETLGQVRLGGVGAHAVGTDLGERGPPPESAPAARAD